MIHLVRVLRTELGFEIAAELLTANRLASVLRDLETTEHVSAAPESEEDPVIFLDGDREGESLYLVLACISQQSAVDRVVRSSEFLEA